MAARRWILLLALLAAGSLMSAEHTYQTYIDGVRSGDIVSCRWVKLAVERHVQDLAKAKAGEFPYSFDDGAAGRAIDFVQQLRHTKGVWASSYGGRNTRITLEPWEQFIVAMLHGWRNEAGYRRFTRAYVEVARKNGKTTLGAALGNLAFFADRPKEIGPEVYFGATKQEQAAIAWSEAKLQIEKHPFLSKLIKHFASKQTIMIPGTASRMRPLGRDSNTEDGLNPSFFLIDEYHAHPDSSILDVLESGTGARQQPLGLIITTAGLDKNCPCYMQEHELTRQILEGSLDPKPENMFGIIYTLDDGDTWTDSSVWIKANPNLGVSVRHDFLEQRVKLALASAGKQNDVKTKNLNIWTQSVKRWITDEQWMENGSSFDVAGLAGRRAFAAFDLSSSQDLTAAAIVFPPIEEAELWKIIWRFWLPEDGILEHIQKDKVPYGEWIDQGLIVPTPGNVVDYDWIEGELVELADTYDIVECAYDPWRAAEVVNHMTAAGLTMVAVRQAYNPMAIYVDALEKKILSKQVAHGGHPIARWNMSCVEMKSDRQGNVMPMKPERDKTGKRIDGIVAAIMAMGRAVVSEGAGGASVYEERGILTL